MHADVGSGVIPRLHIAEGKVHESEPSQLALSPSAAANPKAARSG
jgi:hypothetical protein